jgi:hypothetical protein
MLYKKMKKMGVIALTLALAFITLFAPVSQIKAADHAESTSVGADPGADIADVFAFLSPNNNSRVVLAIDVEGFIVPSELLNLGYFPSDIVYRFEIENTGDAIPDQAIDVTFSPQTSRSSPQIATIRMSPNPVNGKGGTTFTAPTTVQTLNAVPNPFVVTNNQATGAAFFAGMTDDPFFFDIVGTNRFVGSVLGGNPNGAFLNRARDSFAGYNIHMIAIEVPADMLRGSNGNVIGVNGVTLRQRNSHRKDNGEVSGSGNLVQVDRMGVPAVNTVLIPFSRKNEYNAATPQDDANGVFAGSIVSTLTALGTNQTNIGILASVAVAKGDYLRLDLAKPNPNLGVGERIESTPNYAGFPNGRRPGDDTVDTLLYFITNQGLTTGDNVNGNSVPFGATFPFFAPPIQPLENPAIDGTQN